MVVVSKSMANEALIDLIIEFAIQKVRDEYGN